MVELLIPKGQFPPILELSTVFCCSVYQAATRRPILVDKVQIKNSLPTCGQNNLAKNWQAYSFSKLETKVKLVRNN